LKAFTIFVPVYNEEEILQNNVAKLAGYADTLGVPYEIIAVSNGSTDGSDQIGCDLQKENSHFRYFSLPEKGVGRAFKKGIREAKYDHIIFMDADLSSDLAFIGRANQLLDQNVMVMGAKFKGLQNRSLFRKLGSAVFYLSVLILMRMNYVDYAPGAKAYQKGFLKEFMSLIDDYTSFVLNLAFIASLKKRPVKEIPIECTDLRKSRFNLWKEAGSKYKGLFSLKLKQITKQI
jgi:glycosyltransferase involved in cell wall biosynthesis